MEERSCNHCCSVKAIHTTSTYSECVSVALVIQYAVRLLHVVVCPAEQYFSTLSHKRLEFGKKVNY